jgi:hypothetical protein
MDFLPIEGERADTPPAAEFGPLFGEDAPHDADTGFETFDELKAVSGADGKQADPETVLPAGTAPADPWRDNPWSGPASAEHSYDEPAPSAPTLFDAVPQTEDATPDVPSPEYRLEFVEIKPGPGDSWSSIVHEQEPASPAVETAAMTPPVTETDVRATSGRASMPTRQLAMVGGGVLAAGALIFTILGMRGAASPEPAAAPAPARRTPAAAPARPKPAAPAAVTAGTPAADAPRWSRVTDGRWIGAGKHSAAFEVAATGRVHVWTRDVTPVLVVRCDKGRTEAFVYTQSAARMEPQDGDHTVQVAFDGGSPATERWPDSAEHDALFARQPAEFTRQLTQSRTLQFGFTPHNAEPAVATFVLEGLESLLASSAKQCGWKPQETKKPGV